MLSKRDAGNDGGKVLIIAPKDQNYRLKLSLDFIHEGFKIDLKADLLSGECNFTLEKPKIIGFLTHQP